MPNNADEPLPQTLAELCDWIEAHAAEIYVREEAIHARKECRGKWTTYRLTDLTPARAIHHTLRFIRDGLVPVYVPAPKDRPEDDGLAKGAN